jgi:hypothetical protein
VLPLLFRLRCGCQGSKLRAAAQGTCFQAALSNVRRRLLAVDVETRTLVRRRVSDARRRLTGAEFDETGVVGMQTSGSRNKSLPLVAWEACDGDSLLALAYVLDVLKAKQEGQLDAA